MATTRNQRLTQSARQLRREATSAEAVVWGLLRRGALGVRFRRQQTIGRYIVDFVAPSMKLVVELDGAGHYDDATSPDQFRDRFLLDHGYRVLRVENRVVFVQPDDLLVEIRRLLDDPGATPTAAFQQVW